MYSFSGVGENKEKNKYQDNLRLEISIYNNCSAFFTCFLPTAEKVTSGTSFATIVHNKLELFKYISTATWGN